MNNIVKELNQYPAEYWDFKGVTKSGIHNIGKYPATMVPDMQHQLLSIISKHLNGKNIALLDPFCGSGTTLVIAQELGINSVGIDINPYATLLSFVKTNKYNKLDICNSISTMEKNLEQESNFQIYDFYNIKKWFRDDIIKSLSKIRHCILLEKKESVRKFFWICLSEVIFKFSNDRTSTFKLHALPKERIDLIEDKCIEFFVKIIKDNSKYLNYSITAKSNIIYGDSSSIIDDELKGKFNIICTSPPYGDNSTTVTYGQSSILFLKWIDSKDLLCESDLLSTYSRIDYLSLGGNKNHNGLPDISIIHEYIDKLSDNKKNKVIRFLSDYYKSLYELEKVLAVNGYVIFTVGNRRVDGIEQPFDKITENIFKSLGLRKVELFKRNILFKKMPKKISKIKNKGSVESMSKETVIIYKKEK